MTLRIERSTDAGLVVFALSGRIEALDVAELQRVLSQEQGSPHLIFDLHDIVLVDRDAVKFLANCEAAGIRLENCPLYIRAWIDEERK